jgi:dTDP-4-dehydrorhamnose reductase
MKPRPLAWITGAGGLIGHQLVALAEQYAPNFQIEPLTRQRLNLVDFTAVKELFETRPPQLIIHCAAMSKSPACEATPALARQVNVEATQRLAGLAADIPFLFFSTDLVFDGKTGFYDESAAVNPLNVYGETKAVAERIVLDNPRHTVIRTSLNGGTSPTGDRGFNEEMRRGWLAGRALRLFTDEYRAPLPAAVTARAVWSLAASGACGLFHLAGGVRLSRWEIGRLVADRWPQLHPRIEAGSLRQYEGPPRAPDTSLNCAKIQALLPFQLPGLGEWLAANPAAEF